MTTTTTAIATTSETKTTTSETRHKKQFVAAKHLFNNWNWRKYRHKYFNMHHWRIVLLLHNHSTRFVKYEAICMWWTDKYEANYLHRNLDRNYVPVENVSICSADSSLTDGDVTATIIESDGSSKKQYPWEEHSSRMAKNTIVRMGYPIHTNLLQNGWRA